MTLAEADVDIERCPEEAHRMKRFFDLPTSALPRRVGLLGLLCGVLALSAFVLVNQLSVSAAPAAAARIRSGSIGLAQGQTVRLSVANTGGKDLDVTMTFLDDQGSPLFECNEIVEGGEIYWMDLNGDEVADKAPARVQLRAEVKVKGS